MSLLDTIGLIVGGDILKQKILSLISLSFTIFIMVVPNAAATSLTVIREGNAGGYEYTISQDQNKITWKIIHKGNTIVIDETEGNREQLDYFKRAVREIKVQTIKLVSYAIGLLFVTIATVIFHKKKYLVKGGGAIFALLVILALSQIVIASTDLSSLYKDAGFYYYRLTN